MRKLWRVDSDCSVLVRALHRDQKMDLQQRRDEWRKYPCSHGRRMVHVSCAGQVTRDTQHYPLSFARVVHRAWRDHTDMLNISPCMCAIPSRVYWKHIRSANKTYVAGLDQVIVRSVRFSYRVCRTPQCPVQLPCSACGIVPASPARKEMSSHKNEESWEDRA